MIIITISV